MVQMVVFSWSGGKDSALALYEIKKTGAYEVLRLITTVAEEYARVSIHGVRRNLLEEQAASLGLPLDVVFISRSISDEEYGLKMEVILSRYLAVGVSSIVFGDIFLEDVRRYREGNLSKMGMRGIFPNWKKDTHELAKTFIDLGFGDRQHNVGEHPSEPGVQQRPAGEALYRRHEGPGFQRCSPVRLAGARLGVDYSW